MKPRYAGIVISIIIFSIFIYMGIHSIYVTAQTDGPVIKYYFSGFSIIISAFFIIAQMVVIIKDYKNNN